MPGADVTAEQMLRITADDKPDHVCIVARDSKGEWGVSWTNMTLGELAFAAACLQAKVQALLMGGHSANR